MRIKICGLTRPEDVILCRDLGAWRLGFILTSQSLRHISWEQALTFIDFAQVRDRAVAVVSDQDLLGLSGLECFTAVQLHGQEDLSYVQDLRKFYQGQIIKAIRLKDQNSVSEARSFLPYVDGILVDHYDPKLLGGTGQIASWDLAWHIYESVTRIGKDFILAGGLGEANLAVATKSFPVASFDLSSGVEQSPGIKDPQKLQSLFQRFL